MKRASLKTAVVPVVSATSHDVTDRLLKPEPAPAKAPTAPAPEPRPQPRTRRPKREESAPVSAPNTLVPAPNPLAKALNQTEMAITALQQARASAPAQYDVAVRYRLDALAHHLQQVAAFVARSLEE